MRNINYIQPENLSCINDSYCYIHDKSESYAIWERQKDNQFWIETGYSQIINPDFSNHYFGIFSLSIANQSAINFLKLSEFQSKDASTPEIL